ncbi:crotonobetaine/carnitine-CoA ligase [Edwardsiella piscicida]|uniref:crotonobetaine/carnitine-CoA ligase n=1 Tax=Edwardsiella piscicida TaxID=1263550 RepID=UPI0002C0EDF3|nr:crotonobetaine/carnitine-CoA ligase [Edwardsiella piscicida]AGH74676.1 crotonobetaine/carnitine-CoA ligase [Edwardsiella piscicida C07-087]EKS7766406.1 crotonobetaine/carnitine-CoA ligase [Edwardsiella piscicida]EKS7779551.1 crotonobetaine/carnitine-CoA ligase [Edwardsiella piscicida]EKS7782972.1 crotonobetaine/carnitine-CoA ligase [Edwardsiella piscicida]UCQ23691.1 crotonobetaine/carnitine-CoA ligase [Edwardsiella piscicida]
MDMIGNATLRDVWQARARHQGAQCALVYEDLAGDTREYSYRQMHDEIIKAANLFLSLEVRKGDRVALQMRNCPEFLFCWFGLACIGAIAVPVNTGYTEQECDYLLGRCGVSLLVCQAAFLPLYRRLSHPLRHRVILREGEGEGEDEATGTIDFQRACAVQPCQLREQVPLSADDVAEILFTSGTTACPKGVELTHANLLFGGHYTAWQGQMTASDRYLSCMPNFHIDFQCSAAMPMLMTGGTLILLEKYSARRFWRQVCLHRATLSHAMPLIVRTLMLQPPRAWERNHCLRDLFFYLNITDAEKQTFERRFGVRLFNSYGMTETVVGAIGDTPGQARRYPSIGRPGMGYQARIVDAQGNPLPPGQVGEICIRGVAGRTLFKGYYDDPAATARLLRGDGWLHSGDTGYCDEEGWFYFVDRAVNLIKRSGENVASSEVEGVLETHPAVSEAAVIGVADPLRDQAVKAIVQLTPGAEVRPETLIAHCAAHLAAFKVPTLLEFVAEFPRTCSGKVDKKRLRLCCG